MLPLPEDPPNVERIAEIVSKYNTEIVLPPGSRLDREVKTLLSEKGAGAKTPAPFLPH